MLAELLDQFGCPTTPARYRGAVLAQFMKFSLVGSVGLLFDTATVYAARGMIGIYAAGIIAYGAAATVTWALNRIWTFRKRRGGGPLHRQWALFLATNLPGFVLNRSAFVALVALVPFCARQPVWAVAGGSIAGMGLNFGLSRSVVFRPAE